MRFSSPSSFVAFLLSSAVALSFFSPIAVSASDTATAAVPVTVSSGNSTSGPFGVRVTRYDDIECSMEASSSICYAVNVCLGYYASFSSNEWTFVRYGWDETSGKAITQYFSDSHCTSLLVSNQTTLNQCVPVSSRGVGYSRQSGIYSQCAAPIDVVTGTAAVQKSFDQYVVWTHYGPTQSGAPCSGSQWNGLYLPTNLCQVAQVMSLQTTPNSAVIQASYNRYDEHPDTCTGAVGAGSLSGTLGDQCQTDQRWQTGASLDAVKGVNPYLLPSAASPNGKATTAAALIALAVLAVGMGWTN